MRYAPKHILGGLVCLAGVYLLIGLTGVLQWTLIDLVEMHPWVFVILGAALFWWSYRYPANYHD